MSTLFDDFHSEDFNGFVDDSQYSNLFGSRKKKKEGKKGFFQSGLGTAVGSAVGGVALGLGLSKLGRKKRKQAEAQQQGEAPLVSDLKQAKVETAIVKQQAQAVTAEAEAREAVAVADQAEADAEIAKTKTVQAKVKANETIANSSTNTAPLDVKGKIDEAPKTEVVVEQTGDDNTKKILAIAGIGLIVFLLWKNEAFS